MFPTFHLFFLFLFFLGQNLCNITLYNNQMIYYLSIFLCLIEVSIYAFEMFLIGKQMARVELRGVSQKDEFVRRVKEAVRSQFPTFL